MRERIIKITKKGFRILRENKELIVLS